MRRWNLRTCDPDAAALFCRETARYYHRLFSATYSLRTPMVKHMTKPRTTRAIGLGFHPAPLVVPAAAIIACLKEPN